MRSERIFALLALLTTVHAAPAQGVDVVSALGPQVELEALDAVVEARETYASLGLQLRKPYLPTLVIVLPTVVELAPYIAGGVGRSRALSFAGADRNYILLAWAAPGSPLRAAAHEYAHLVDPLAEAPIWFREGLAEYLSYAARDGTAFAPARNLTRLRDSPWLPLDVLRGASRTSPAFQAPTFYAQSWLIVHWLASRGRQVRALRPGDLDEAIAALGRPQFEAALRTHFDQLAIPLEDESQGSFTIPTPPLRPDWDVRLALAEVDRELGRRDKADEALLALESERPDDPQLAAARGAVAMDAGRYDEAETRFVAAARDPQASARTHYRLALMLLRPQPGETRRRARQAAGHARRALEQIPSSPDFRLTLAHALMVDEAWDAGARELRALAAEPAWRTRAEEEMQELLRRRQQALSAVEKPAYRPAPPESALSVTPLELAAIPLPPKPPPPPPMRWPPPGATILAGRLDYVDCSGEEKIIVMRHPLLTLRFREPKGKPAKLFLPPQRSWTEIPCGAKGWTINLAYREYYNDMGLTGEALAILF